MEEIKANQEVRIVSKHALNIVIKLSKNKFNKNYLNL